MKIPPAGAAAFCAKPPESVKAALIHGPDAAEVAQLRRTLIRALAGPEAETEMRLTSLDVSAVRSDPAAIEDALRAQGFFPGRRVVWLADATEALAPSVATALGAASPRDA